MHSGGEKGEAPTGWFDGPSPPLILSLNWRHVVVLNITTNEEQRLRVRVI